MVEAGAKLQRQKWLMPGIKEGFVLINMAAMTLQMWTFSLKMTRSYRSTDMVGNHVDEGKKISVEGWEVAVQCQAFCPCANEREEGWVANSRTNDTGWYGKEMLPDGCKIKRRFQEDGKVRGKSAMSNMTLTLLNTPLRKRKYYWWMESSGEGQQHNIWSWPC